MVALEVSVTVGLAIGLGIFWIISTICCVAVVAAQMEKETENFWCVLCELCC